jgi:hypothetical protein
MDAMKKTIPFFCLLTLSFFASAQEKSFTFSQRKGGPIVLTTSSDTIQFDRYKEGKANTINRLVNLNGAKYTLSILRNNERIQSFIDSEGVAKAALSLRSKKNRYDLVLPDGTVLDCRFKGYRWFYSRDGKDILSGRVKTEKRKKKIVIDVLDPSSVTPEVLLASLERGTNKIVSSRNTVLWAVPVVTVLLVRGLVTSRQEEF